MGPTIVFPATSAGSATPSGHSTSSDPRASLRQYAHATFTAQSVDLERSNEWLLGFMDKIGTLQGAHHAGDSRPVLANLLKSAKKPRGAGLSPLPPSAVNSPISHLRSTTHPSNFSKGLLFPTSSHPFKPADKENARSADHSPTPRSPARSPLDKSPSGQALHPSQIGLGSAFGALSPSTTLRGAFGPPGAARVPSPRGVAVVKKARLSEEQRREAKEAAAAALVIVEEDEEADEDEDEHGGAVLASGLAAQLGDEARARAASEEGLAAVREEDEEASSDDTMSDEEGEEAQFEEAKEESTQPIDEAELSMVAEAEEPEDEPAKARSPVRAAAALAATSSALSVESVSVVAETQAPVPGSRAPQPRNVSAMSMASDTYEDADEDFAPPVPAIPAELVASASTATVTAASASAANVSESTSSIASAATFVTAASNVNTAPATDDESIPLNDEPSVLRTALNSSIPASASTRTPGSAGALSFLLGSSSAAPSTVPKPLVFKTLGGAKKSLGPGAILAGRQSVVADSQGSTASAPAGLQRKSVANEDGANKAAKVEPTSPGAKSREAMRARLAAAGGKRMSNFSGNGVGADAGLGVSTFKPMSQTPAAAVALLASGMPKEESVSPPAPGPVAEAVARVTSPRVGGLGLGPAPSSVPTLSRQPSFADRRTLFEQNSARDSALPSPSKPTPASLIPRSPIPSSTSGFSLAAYNALSPKTAQVAFKPVPHKLRPNSPVAGPKSPARTVAVPPVFKGSTTPMGSPPPKFGFKQAPVSQAPASSIAQLMEEGSDTDLESDESELDPEEMTFAYNGGIRAVQPSTRSSLTESQRDEGEDDLPELPPPVSARPSSVDDMALRSGVVERGQGALASALDLKAQPKAAFKPTLNMKVIAQSTTGVTDESDEDELELGKVAAQLVPKSTSKAVPQSATRPRTITKQPSNSSLSSTASAQPKARLISGKPTQLGASSSAKAALAKSTSTMATVDSVRKAAEAREAAEARAAKAALQKKEVEEAKRLAMARVREAEQQKLREQDERHRREVELAKAKMGLKTANPLAASGSVRNLQAPVKAGPSSGSANPAYQRSALGSSAGRTLTQAKVGASAGQAQVGQKFMKMPTPSIGGGPGYAGQGHKFGNAAVLASSATTSHARSAGPPKPTPAPAAEEPYVELDDIDSEYSDSDSEEHRQKQKAYPQWVQSPALAVALKQQATVNPDDVFGPIPELKMSEIFKVSAKEARMHKRTSSACWEGVDAFVREDTARYNKAMGFASKAVGDKGVQGGR